MAEMAMSFVVEELSNVKNLEENMQLLKQKIESLNSREVDVLIELQGIELGSGKKPRREVEIWLKNVYEKRKQFEQLDQEVGQTRMYNIVARRRLAKQVVQEVDEVAKLVEQGRFSEGVVLDAAVKESMPIVTFDAKGFSFEHNLENIWAWLMDDEVSSVGIYGMGGVGKTTLAMNLHDKIWHEPKFSNCVYWVTVSQEFDSFKLQNDIAKAMNIYILDEDDEKKRAAILFQALSKREKFVLILDDVWKQFDMGKIGVPFQRDGCKFLVTSRFADVCQRIGCQKLMKVEALFESEAWEIFQEELGPTMLGQNIKEMAKKVVEKCDGLPLGIITMARSMRGVTNIHGWKDALEELNECCMAQDDMKSEVLPILLYSFNRLRNQKLKNCFLYCSLYPEDHLIPKEELINNFITEELMDRRSSRQAEFDQGHAILAELENSCLLIRCGNKYVKMHDLMREMALWITRDNPRFMVKAGRQLKEIPGERDWKEDLNKVSLMKNEITDIPLGTAPKCPCLSTLNLSYNPLTAVPESLFVHMCRLKVLDLRETNIVQLPNSISDLGDLKALLLGRCWKLKSLPSLKKLKELIELDLCCTSIREVIHGMESLANLKCLNLYCVSPKMIPSEALQRLSRLQSLILPLREAVAAEDVKGLGHLEEFQGTFRSIHDLSGFVVSQQRRGKLSSYDIGVGNAHYAKSLSRKSVTLRRCSLKEMGRGDEIMLPRDIEEFYIESCEDMEWLMRLPSNEELMQERRWLLLENLDYLCLNRLRNLIGMIQWEPGAVRAPPPGILCRLKKLRIFCCKSIKKLLPWGLVGNLRNLEELHASSCEQMEQIIGEDEGIYSGTNVTLPRLRILKLYNLPKLKIISMSTTICVSIETIKIKSCTKLEKIPLFYGQQLAPPMLKNIIISFIEREWWDSLEWDHFNIRNVLQPFIRYEIT